MIRSYSSHIHFIDKNHQVECVTCSDGTCYYLPQFKKWNGISYYYANYRNGMRIVSYGSLHNASGHIQRSTIRKYYK